jgi:hypothetical protein
LVFCGKLLRSKTTKKRLTTCRAHEVRGAAAPCYKITVFALLYEKQKKLFLAKHQTKFPKRNRKNDNTTTVRKPNLLSNARIKPSFFQQLRSSHLPKHKTKKHSFFNLLRKQSSPKRKTQKHLFFKEKRLCFSDVSEAVALDFCPL